MTGKSANHRYGFLSVGQPTIFLHLKKEHGTKEHGTKGGADTSRVLTSGDPVRHEPTRLVFQETLSPLLH